MIYFAYILLYALILCSNIYYKGRGREREAESEKERWRRRKEREGEMGRDRETSKDEYLRIAADIMLICERGCMPDKPPMCLGT